ncbi:MAG: PEGA domain-containing protein [Patescibacteria group bacterium]|jgi:hypothetical protein
MRLLHRRLLALTFICLFLVCAPLAVAYSRGFRFDPKSLDFYKTGAIVLSGKPKSVLIQVNAEPGRTKSLPTSIRNLRPGTYQLSLSAPGYEPWQQEVRVRDGEATILDPVQLFRTPAFETVRTAIGAGAKFAPQGGSVAWRQGSTLTITTPTTLVTCTSIPEGQTFVWDSQGQRLVVLGKDDTVLGTCSRQGVWKQIPVPPAAVRFASADGDTLLATTPTGLALLRGNTWVTATVKNLKQAVLNNGKSFSLVQTPTGFALLRLNDQLKTMSTQELPASIKTPKLFGDHQVLWISDATSNSSLWIRGEQASDVLTLPLLAHTAQRIPGTADVLFINAFSAMIGKADGASTTASRWITPVFGVTHLGRETVSIARADRLLIRHIPHNTVLDIPLEKGVAVSQTSTEGVLEFLLEDGKILRWVQLQVF